MLRTEVAHKGKGDFMACKSRLLGREALFVLGWSSRLGPIKLSPASLPLRHNARSFRVWSRE